MLDVHSQIVAVVARLGEEQHIPTWIPMATRTLRQNKKSMRFLTTGSSRSHVSERTSGQPLLSFSTRHREAYFNTSEVARTRTKENYEALNRLVYAMSFFAADSESGIDASEGLFAKQAFLNDLICSNLSVDKHFSKHAAI